MKCAADAEGGIPVAGRLEEGALIQEQAIRLREAVKAAQVRTSRRPANKSTRLRKLLLKPLKMLCYSSPTGGHALALPAGIQDADLVRFPNKLSFC